MSAPNTTPASDDADTFTREEYETACSSAETLAFLKMARVWIDRWEALGGSFLFMLHPNGQPRELLRGMIASEDQWTPADAERDDLRFQLIRWEDHSGAVLALEGMLELSPGLRAAVYEIGGGKALTRWMRAEEA